MQNENYSLVQKQAFFHSNDLGRVFDYRTNNTHILLFVLSYIKGLDRARQFVHVIQHNCWRSYQRPSRLNMFAMSSYRLLLHNVVVHNWRLQENSWLIYDYEKRSRDPRSQSNLRVESSSINSIILIRYKLPTRDWPRTIGMR